jgi:hypothetical protein
MDRSQQMGLVEVMLPYESPFVGRTPAEGSGWPGPSSRWWVCAEGVRPWSPVDCARRS